MALVAAASMRLEKFLEIFRAVIICKFFAGLDILDGIDLDPASDDTRFAIRLAGMVDVAGNIVMFLSIDRPLGIDIEQVTTSTTISLFVSDLFARVFNNERILWNVGCREKPKSGAGPRPTYGI